MLDENEFLMSQGFVFVDVETTGLHASTDRVIEIGILKVKNGKVVGKYSSLINPEMPIPEDSTKVCGIGDTDVADAPTFAQVADQIVRFFETGVVVAHNADFDYAFLQTELNRIGQSFTKPTLDTIALSKFFYPTQGSHRLDAISKKHKIRILSRHRALDDARALHKFLEKLSENFGEKRLKEVISKLIQHRTSKVMNGNQNQDSLL
jgi:DNA polymerase III epsilon subunit family exonuclease